MEKGIRVRIVLLTAALAASLALVSAFTFVSLYRVSLGAQKARLLETAKSWARIVESFAEQKAPGDYNAPNTITLDHLIEHLNRVQTSFTGFGESGEFTLGRRSGDNIEYLLSHRHLDFREPSKVPWESRYGEPMRRALSQKKGGTLIGLDYRGMTVLAAYEPVKVHSLGIVAKIDIEEVRRPFIWMGALSGALSILLVILGAFLIHRTGVIFTKRILKANRDLAAEIENHKKAQESLAIAHTDLETANEELTATNEELEATNEEYMRTQEELEHNYRNLQESEERFRLLATLAPVGIYLSDRSGRCLYVNPRWCEMTGLSQNEAMGDGWVNGLHPDDRASVRRDWEAMVTTGGTWGSEYRFLTPEGKSTWVYGIARRTGTGEPDRPGFIGINTDITALKEAEERLQDSLSQKEILLRELYHRTKNNMQVICGLLRLQAEESKNPVIVSALGDTERRVMSMALVHQKLYQSHDLSRIGFAGYIRSLADYVRNGAGGPVGNISLRFDLVDAVVSIDCAVPCGLILNELLSNSFKHAFPGGGKGEIAISLARNGDMLVIGYADDGAGIPDGTDIRQSNTLGVRLIFQIAEQQLGGTVDWRSGRGLSYTITFPDNPGQCRV
ncbi:MAG: PAS domain S-box protein [Spirochaetes bacterium]|nr:MAG: PAS domain S-box protein [Spirochaetota bacterium]